MIIPVQIQHASRSISHFRISSVRLFSSVSKCDALVLGGGIGGVSVSYRLAKLQNLNVICLEKQAKPGYHPTQKAVEIFAESNARCVQSKILTVASRSFFDSPDKDCIDNYIRDNFGKGILEKTGLIAVSSPYDYPFLYEQFGPTEGIKFNQNIQVKPQTDVRNMVPFLNTDKLAPYAIYEPNAANFNIGLVYQHFLIGGSNNGVKYHFDQSAVEITKNNNGNWEVMSYNADRNEIDRYEAGILVNCTGRWADKIATEAAIKPLGLVSQQRNEIEFTYGQKATDTEQDPSPFIKRMQAMQQYASDEQLQQTPWLGWISWGEIFHSYFQKGNGVFLMDRPWPMEDDIDIGQHEGQDQDEMAVVLHKIKKYTTLKVQNVESKAAGIKCSTKHDKNIVVGPSVEDSSFIWCAALGSYEFQTAPAYSEIISYLTVNQGLPNKYIDLGINVDKLLPARLYN